MMDVEHFEFNCNGEMWLLNGYLLDLKKIDNATKEIIIIFHHEKQLYIDTLARCQPTDLVHLRDLAEKITEVEYKLQDAWGFIRDSDWHKHWELPHCKCSAKDNLFAYPHHTIINKACPLHGLSKNKT